MNLPNGLMKVLSTMKNIRGEVLENGDTLDWFAGNGKMVILHRYAKDNGWDVYIQPNQSNRIQEAIEELEEYLVA